MLPSGVTIVASGAHLSLDEFIESLAESQREAKKAREQGLDARTFQSVMRDKARNSGLKPHSDHIDTSEAIHGQ